MSKDFLNFVPPQPILYVSQDNPEYVKARFPHRIVA